MLTRIYPKPSRIWVEGDQVFAEAYDGTVVMMTAEVAIYVSRQLGIAGGDALMNRVAVPASPASHAVEAGKGQLIG